MPRTRQTPTRTLVSQDVVEVVTVMGETLDLGDLRALVKTAEGLRDDAALVIDQMTVTPDGTYLAGRIRMRSLRTP